MDVRYFDIAVARGTYVSKKDNTEKTDWLTVGFARQNEKGQMSFRLEALPTGMDENTWFNIFERKA